MKQVPPDTENLKDFLNSTAMNIKSTEIKAVVDRKRMFSGTFPKEIVQCRLEDGRDIEFYCKYSSGHGHSSFGHRGGLNYEARVYQEVLESSLTNTPALFGVYTNKSGNEVWLILEHLHSGVGVAKSKDPWAMPRAAQWIANFHSQNARELRRNKFQFINLYDSKYYTGWIERTIEFAGNLIATYPWLTDLCDNFGEVLSTLLSGEQTIIHGEYYPKNILYQEGNIYPVDWESTAIASGEIDLASLTEWWPEDITLSCLKEYKTIRWPNGVPDNFERIFDASRLYLNLRWLGDRREWTTSKGSIERFDELFVLGERLGLL